ncbi:MAG: hypothetical protein HYV23_08000 [Deltaproteobacteria bacterium]|nr:hypothetical protein [Deltaproteobacteria bacterium]
MSGKALGVLKDSSQNSAGQGATVVQTLRGFDMEKEGKTRRNKGLKGGAKIIAGAKNVSTLL